MGPSFYSGQPGDHLLRSAQHTAESAMLRANTLKRNNPKALNKVRFEFEFNGARVFFNPFEASSLLATRVVAERTRLHDEYRASDEYKARQEAGYFSNEGYFADELEGDARAVAVNRFIIGQFLDIIPRKIGLPPIFFYKAEQALGIKTS